MIADSLIDYFKTLNTSLKVEEITTIMNTPASTFPVTFQPLFTDPSILNLTQSLLNENREFETNESKSKKDNALQSLQDIVSEWSIHIAEYEKQIHRSQLQACAARLVPYGSVILGVASQDSDMDLICVAPLFLDRKKHFFEDLFNILGKNKDVTKINKIEQSFNPIIKMEYRGYSIDMNFAQINSDIVPDDIDKSLDELRKTILNTDKPTIDALNGRKNGILIRNSVKDFNQFVRTLRLVKLWSKQRAVKGNIIGYLGGISWAILVARICQLFPCLNVFYSISFILSQEFQTLYMFFKVYSYWNFNQYPIKIYNSELDQQNVNEGFLIQSWTDTPHHNEPYYKMELMKIITPAVPVVNSARKVNWITYQSIINELQRGLEILESETLTDLEKWKLVFEKFDFFSYFKHYVTISIVSNVPKDFHKWCGICEAKMVNLLKNISEHVEQKEQHNDYEIRITSFGLEDLEPNHKKSVTYLIGIKKKQKEAWPLFLIQPVTKFQKKMMEDKKQQINGFWEDDNLKIYFQNKQNLNVLFQKQEERKLKRNNEYSDEEIIKGRKKVKTEIMNSAQLQKVISTESVQFDTEELNKKIDELF